MWATAVACGMFLALCGKVARSDTDRMPRCARPLQCGPSGGDSCRVRYDQGWTAAVTLLAADQFALGKCADATRDHPPDLRPGRYLVPELPEATPVCCPGHRRHGRCRLLFCFPLLLIFVPFVADDALGKDGGPLTLHQPFPASRTAVPAYQPTLPSEGFGGCGRGRYNGIVPGPPRAQLAAVDALDCDGHAAPDLPATIETIRRGPGWHSPPLLIHRRAVENTRCLTRTAFQKKF